MAGGNTAPALAKNVSDQASTLSVESNVIKNAKFSQIAGSFDSLFTSIDSKNSAEGEKGKFRSLDFSNVGIKNDMRRWHQTIIYIQDVDTLTYNGDSVSTKNYVITANLPESFNYTIGSEYESPIQFGSSVGNLAAQAVTEGAGSGVLKAGTIKIWKGSKPMSFTLDIPVLDDGWSAANQNGKATDLMESLEILSCLCLPRYAEKQGEYSELAEFLSAFSYQPPPNPIAATISYKDDDGNSQTLKVAGGTGKIMCQVGGMLLVDNCILESIDVSYPNTKAMLKHTYSQSTEIASGIAGNVEYLTPIIANLKLKFFVPVALSAEDYRNMIWLHRQKNNTTFNIDVSNIGLLNNGIKQLAKLSK